MDHVTVVGIGELLWDVFPDKRRMGGAPVNFACMSSQLGARAIPVSCLGEDDDAQEILQNVQALGLGVDYIQQSNKAPTGTVDVVLDENSKPTYAIREDVAWDLIELTPSLRKLASGTHAVCFGSLAQRCETSRRSIQEFVRRCPDGAVKIFDVNLRQSFFSSDVVDQSLGLANILKVSDEELPVLARMFDLGGSVSEQILELIQRYDLRLVAYTRGGDGSMLVAADAEVEHPGEKPNAIDTVGAGDSYTAALCMGLLAQMPLSDVIDHASRVSAYVCEQEGATPTLPDLLKLRGVGSAATGIDAQ